jgi:hypothetical protein
MLVVVLAIRLMMVAFFRGVRSRGRGHGGEQLRGALPGEVLRGRSLTSAAIRTMSSTVWTLRSVAPGEVVTQQPFMFSLLPRCRGELRSNRSAALHDVTGWGYDDPITVATLAAFPNVAVGPVQSIVLTFWRWSESAHQSSGR